MGYPTSPPMYPSGAGDPVLLTVGDVAVTRTSVLLPYGRFPLRGTTWTVQNQVFMTTGTPSWAVIMAVLGMLFICVFSLLFLLAKENKASGYLEVTVRGPDGLCHVTRIAALDPYTAQWVYQQVGQAQALAAAA